MLINFLVLYKNINQLKNKMQMFCIFIGSIFIGIIIIHHYVLFANIEAFYSLAYRMLAFWIGYKERFI